MANKAAKLNRAGQSHGGFFHVPYTVMSQTTMRNGKERKLTPSMRIFASAVYSLSTDKTPADFTLPEIAKRYGFSKATSFRTVKAARDGGLVRRTDKVWAYVFEGDVGDGRRLYFEDCWFHAKFGRGEEARTPNLDDVFVLAYIKSFYDDYGEKWEMSRRYIAKGLNISLDKVCKAVNFFKEAGVLFTKRGMEHKSRTIFTVSDKALEKAKKSTVKRAKTPSTAVQEADEKAEIESSYARKRAFAEWKAGQKKAQANADETYRAAEAEIKRLDKEAGKAEANAELAERNGNAELYKTATELLNELTERKRATQQLRRESLERLGISEESLTPQYSCKKCSDTGFLPDGRVCECYPRGRP